MRGFAKFLDWIGRFQVVQSIIQNLWAFLPIGWLIGTGWAGYVTGQPLMWIMVAVAASASFVCVALLDKIKFVIPNVGFDYINQKASKIRKISYSQVMIQLRNDAHFPMSVYLENAETSIEALIPPRTKYPGQAVLVGSQGIFFLMDARIEMQNQACRDLTGEAHFRVRYGKAGNEKYVLDVKGTLFIGMDPTGFVKGIWFNHSGNDVGSSAKALTHMP